MAKKFVRPASLAGLLTLLILAVAVAAAAAPPAAPPTGAVIQPTLQLRVPPAQVRTRAQVEAAAALEASGPPPPAQVKKFLPTRGAAYNALKAKAAQSGALQIPLAPGLESAAPLAPTALTNPINFEGVDSVTAGNWRPPDTHGAVGLNHFVEITNSHLDIYEKATPNNRVNGGGNGVPLSAFFGYTTQSLFDVRAIYDPVFNRWIISADAFAESTTVQWFFFAVSQTADPLGTFFIYRVNVSDGLSTIGAGDVEWDFPQLGMDQNAVIFTANYFHGNTFIDTRMFTVAKSLLYNGPSQTLTPHLFTGLLAGTLAPPIVLDPNPNTYLVAADAPDNKVSIYTLTNSAADPPTLSAPATIPVPAFTFPANAPQPGTDALLDTSDARFVNAGVQIGDSLFQVHSISKDPNILSGAVCRFYEFDTVKRVVIQSGTFSKSGTSFDFNVSIAANRRKDVFVTWSATDTLVNAQVRFSGRLHTDPLGVIPSPGSLLSDSATFYNPAGDPVQAKRWGDYSAVSLDPADPTGATAWIVNEKILQTNQWGSQIGRIALPRFNSSLPAVYSLLLPD